MNIPEKFEDILKKDQVLHGVVLDIISSFQPILQDNKLYFFEEYTDHGIKHIENVLKASELIIAENSYKNLTPNEITILILGILLHDIGMHTEFSTFQKLINGGYDSCRIPELDEKKWPELWMDYLAEVKHFSSKQKKNIFGDEFYFFKEPDLTNKDKLTGFDKKVIGEFIRRHHARLAQEISVIGIYGKKELLAFGNSKLPDLHRNLAGILARSHGMNIRDTFNYLEERFHEGWRNPGDINVIFLMVVLRIADYIQIDSARVNPFLLKLKTFTSPISTKENQGHLAISSLSFVQPDAEKIYVHCEPQNSEMLFKLRKLFSDIQKEFDVSWAVLGEIYGFIPKEKPIIRFRRISSNLTNTKYLSQLEYVPEKIEFAVSNELSKLLVGPLYGNNPTFGVRELLQNSIDACRERELLEKKSENDNYLPNVTVELQRVTDTSSRFTISDNGKGISVTEIKNYFLHIGNSFRHSLTWKKNFQNNGRTEVNRNGKFGIGVLASFLIGDEISVKTTHLKEQISHSFITQIDSEFIEIVKDTQENSIGTVISIPINNEKRKVLENSNWMNWYILDYPPVQFIIDGKYQKYDSIDLSKYRKFTTPNFKSIEWVYSGKKSKSSNYISYKSLVACNGIIITKELGYKKGRFQYGEPTYHDYVIQHKPSLLIEDREGILPIKLDRNDLDCITLPFEDTLLKEISKSFIAMILSVKIDLKKGFVPMDFRPYNIGILYSTDGYSFNSDYFVEKIKGKNSLIKVITSEKTLSQEFIYDNDLIEIIFDRKIQLSYQEEYVAPQNGGIFLLRKHHYENLFLTKINRISKTARKKHVVLSRENEVIMYRYNISPNSPSTKLQKYKQVFENPIFSSVECVQLISYSSKLIGGTILNDLLKEYIGSEIIIPYNLKDRKKLFSKAFKDLKYYFD